MAIPTVILGSPLIPLSIEDLKKLFETGDKPSSADFCSLIEACYGTDQILQFDPATGNLGISTSDGSGFNTVNIGTMLDSNLSFTYDDTNRMLQVTVNGAPTSLGPLDGLWKENTNNDIESKTGLNVGIGTSPALGKKLDVLGNTNLTGALDVSGISNFASKINANGGVEVDGNLKFATGAETVNKISNSTTLAGNSADAIPTEYAVKEYVKDSVLQNMFNLRTKSATTVGVGAVPNLKIDFDNLTGSALYYKGIEFGEPVAGQTRDIFVAPADGRYQFWYSGQISSHTTNDAIIWIRLWHYPFKAATYSIGAFDFAHTQKHAGNSRYSGSCEIYMQQNQVIFLQADVNQEVSILHGVFTGKKLPNN